MTFISFLFTFDIANTLHISLCWYSTCIHIADFTNSISEILLSWEKCMCSFKLLFSVCLEFINAILLFLYNGRAFSPLYRKVKILFRMGISRWVHTYMNMHRRRLYFVKSFKSYGLFPFYFCLFVSFLLCCLCFPSFIDVVLTKT